MLKGKFKTVIMALAGAVLLGLCIGQEGYAAKLHKEVISSTKTLPEAGQFNVITDAFDWGQDVTRVMINPGETVNASDLKISDFSVTSEHYSEKAWTMDTSGPRKVMDVYPVDAEGNKLDEGEYIICELEWGSGVQAAHTGSYSYADYYSPLKLTYNVSWNGQSFKQHEVVNLVCDEFVLERHIDTNIANANNNFVDYAFYAPEDDGAKHPLIVFFHGMGEGGGRDNFNHGVQMYAYPECNFADTEIQGIMGGAYVLLPQSPDQWPTNGFAAESAYIEVVNSLIDTIIEQNPGIDTNRIYVGGLSMGGYMASRVILNRPDMYAAAFLCAQAYAMTDEDADKLVDLPIWVSCSEADTVCRMDPYTYASYEKLIEAGGTDKVCAVMESNQSDPTSRYRFYSSDTEGFQMYYPEQDNKNTNRGEFVWDNVGYSGHNGGWVPVFANGQFYEDENGEKVTIMEWVASKSLAKEISIDTSVVKKEYNVNDAFDKSGLVVSATMRDGSTVAVTDYNVSAPDMTTAGTKEVKISYSGISASYQIVVKAAVTVTPPANTDNPAVTPPAVDKADEKVFKVAKKKLVVKKGKKAKIKVTVSPKTKVKFKSSKAKIAKVSKKGVVKGIKKGKAKITVKAFGKKIVVKVTVK